MILSVVINCGFTEFLLFTRFVPVLHGRFLSPVSAELGDHTQRCHPLFWGWEFHSYQWRSPDHRQPCDWSAHFSAKERVSQISHLAGVPPQSQLRGGHAAPHESANACHTQFSHSTVPPTPLHHPGSQTVPPNLSKANTGCHANAAAST